MTLLRISDNVTVSELVQIHHAALISRSIYIFCVFVECTRTHHWFGILFRLRNFAKEHHYFPYYLTNPYLPRTALYNLDTHAGAPECHTDPTSTHHFFRDVPCKAAARNITPSSSNSHEDFRQTSMALFTTLVTWKSRTERPDYGYPIAFRRDAPAVAGLFKQPRFRL